MGNFSINESQVRVDFFKSKSGKWITTEAVQWIGYDGDIHGEFKKSILEHLGERIGYFDGTLAVCLHPYNINEHPLMMTVRG